MTVNLYNANRYANSTKSILILQTCEWITRFIDDINRNNNRNIYMRVLHGFHMNFQTKLCIITFHLIALYVSSLSPLNYIQKFTW